MRLPKPPVSPDFQTRLSEKHTCKPSQKTHRRIYASSRLLPTRHQMVREYSCQKYTQQRFSQITAEIWPRDQHPCHSQSPSYLTITTTRNARCMQSQSLLPLNCLLACLHSCRNMYAKGPMVLKKTQCFQDLTINTPACLKLPHGIFPHIIACLSPALIKRAS